MRSPLRIVALVFIFLLATVAWMALGGVMSSRTSSQQGQLYGSVAELWGEPLAQKAPTLRFDHQVVTERRETTIDDKGKATVKVFTDRRTVTQDVLPASTRVTADLTLDQRRKGLMWFSLYDVAMNGTWSYTHEDPHEGDLFINFTFPTMQGMYDAFVFEVDGVAVTNVVDPASGSVSTTVPVKPGQKVDFRVGYKSRGMDEWRYVPTAGVGQIKDFSLVMTTDFADIDYPSFTMSPSSRTRDGAGWKLDWTFSQLVSGHAIGMTMPKRIQPGPLASEMSFSAPISLGFFMVWIFVLGLLKKVDVHPINHLFLAAAFFSFHLLFGYSADHLPVEYAFGVSAIVSTVLVVSYLRLAVGSRFAFVEAGLAQLLYLVGFSLAHFWEGYTGLTVTVLGIITLFALMQLTGRIRWGEVMASKNGT